MTAERKQITEYHLHEITGLAHVKKLNDIRGVNFRGDTMLRVLLATDRDGKYELEANTGKIDIAHYHTENGETISLPYQEFIELGKPKTIRQTTESIESLENLAKQPANK